MATTLGDAKYGMSFDIGDGSGNSKAKSISVINYNGTDAGGGSTALGADANTLNLLAKDIIDSVTGGTYTDGNVRLTATWPIEVE